MNPTSANKESKAPASTKQLADTQIGKDLTAFDLALIMKEKPSEYAFLINSELIIRIFLSNGKFAKWTNADFVSLASCYHGLISSGEKLTLPFYKKSYERISDAVEELAYSVDKKTAELIQIQEMMQSRINDYDFKNLDGEKLKARVNLLNNEITDKNNAITNLSNLFIHLDNSLNMNIFSLANSKNFTSSIIDFMLEENKFELSPATLEAFYVAFQNQFHRLDEKTVLFLLNRNDPGKEIMLGNLVKVSAHFFSEVIHSANLSESTINQFAAKVTVKGLDRKSIIKIMFDQKAEPIIRNKVVYNKELLPEDCETLFFDSRTTTAQKIGLLSKMWTNKQEHAVQLANMFRDEQFNQLSEGEVKNLIQAVWLSRGKDLGINPPVCNFNEGYNLFGCWYTYNVNMQKSRSIDAINTAGSFEISLNLYENIKKNKGLHILSTVVHEMAHAEQTKIKFTPNDQKSKELQNLSIAYELTFSLFDYTRAIYLAVTSPVFVQSYDELAAIHKDPFFFKKKAFEPLDYFDLKEDFVHFKRSYSNASVGQLANEISIAKEILDGMLLNKHKDAFNTIHQAKSAHDVYLNYTIELHARRDTINYQKEIIALMQERNLDCKDVKEIHNVHLAAEKQIKHYGKSLENAILIIALEMVKAEIIPLDNIEEKTQSIQEYIASNQDLAHNQSASKTIKRTTNNANAIVTKTTQKKDKTHE